MENIEIDSDDDPYTFDKALRFTHYSDDSDAFKNVLLELQNSRRHNDSTRSLLISTQCTENDVISVTLWAIVSSLGLYLPGLLLS